MVRFERILVLDQGQDMKLVQPEERAYHLEELMQEGA